MMNSYELQYAFLGHLAGLLTFQLFAFDRDSLGGSGQCPTKTEANGYAAYQIQANDLYLSSLVMLGFVGSFIMTGYRLLKKRNRSAFDLVNITQHALLLLTYVRELFIFREMNNAAPFPSEIFQCKTVMQFALTHLGQLCIQAFTMLLLTHFAYEETQRSTNKDKKRALAMYMINYALLGFLAGYYWVFSIIYDKVILTGTATPHAIVGLQQTYTAVLTAPPVYLLASPLALMWSAMLTVIRWSIWRSKLEVAAFGMCGLIALVMALDFLILSHDTLAVEVTDMHSADEMKGFFRITAVGHWLISFVFCPVLCALVSWSQQKNDARLHEFRYVSKELKPPTTISGEHHRKTVKAA